MLTSPRRARAGREQRCLGFEVRLNIGVEVEVVPPQVREHGDVEHDSVDATQDERVTGDLHQAHAHRLLTHDREERLQVGRLRRCERGLDVDPADTRANRADDPRGDGLVLQSALGQPGGGGLALGSRHSHHAQRLGRLVVHPCAQPSENGPRIFDDDRWFRKARRTESFRPRRVREDRDRPSRDRRGGKVSTMGTRAGQGDIEVTDSHALGTQGHSGGSETEVTREGGSSSLPAPATE